MAFCDLREVLCMQPSRRQAPAGERERGVIMEDVIMAVRRLWFGAQVVPMGRAVGVVECGGEMVMHVDEDGPGADRLIGAAAARGAYVVVTPQSRPADLGARLRLAGFTLVQSHATYLFDQTVSAIEKAPAAQEPVRRSGLLSLLRWRGAAQVDIHQIDAAQLAQWNGVCWRAFGSRFSESASLVDKQTAFQNMGASARWYLATVGGRPAGTAILYQDAMAAQILAVGTLPAFQGRGVATAVVRRVIADWERYGQGFLFLDTTPGSPAERLYLKLGFVKSYLREVYAPAQPLS
jgi:ribosomal protein S18 acetylase RimI-like enzyme